MKFFLTIIFLSMGFQTAVAKQYIAGVQKITFRTGPGTENKIISMMEADTPVTLLEHGEEWSKVKDNQGNEGYVMTRFLTKETPYILRYRWLRGQKEKLEKELAKLKEEKESLTANFSQTQRELASTKENLETTHESFEELKSGSAEYLELKTKYEKAALTLENQSDKVAALEEMLSLYYFTWFLAGAGVLLFGWLIGFLTRKNKRNYSGIKL